MTVTLIPAAAVSTGVQSRSAAELDLVPAYSRNHEKTQEYSTIPPCKLGPCVIFPGGASHSFPTIVQEWYLAELSCETGQINSCD